MNLLSFFVKLLIKREAAADPLPASPKNGKNFGGGELLEGAVSRAADPLPASPKIGKNFGGGGLLEDAVFRAADPLPASPKIGKNFGGGGLLRGTRPGAKILKDKGFNLC